MLTHFFIHQWQVRHADERSVLEQQKYKKAELTRLLGTYGANNKRQVIEIELMPEPRDVANIRAIGENLDEINKRLTYYERPYATYEPMAFVHALEAAPRLRYEIVDRVLTVPSRDSAEYGFLRYLNDFFIFLRVTSGMPNVLLSAPIFFFASDRALTRGFEIQAGNLTEDTYQTGFRNAFNAATGQTNLLEWGAQHFVRLYRRSLARAGKQRGAHLEDFLRKEADVVLLDRYLKKLGYGWDIEHDDDQTRFRLGLTRGNMMFFADIFSSGEREIVHFLLAMFALNVQDGLILVDEPELHLHPRWQRIFLALFRELAPARNNQFLIATHSPVFVSPETIESIIRVFRPDLKGSSKVALKDAELPIHKQLVRMINSQNNERMFFADRVVLVEGPSDRLVIGSLVSLMTEIFGDNRAIEVIEVGGKHNFEGYVQLLNALKTPWTVVADLDYLEQVGSAAVQSCFKVDAGSQAETLLKGKKSDDRRALVASIRQYLAAGDRDQLERMLGYLDVRHRQLKSPLTREERALLDAEYVTLSERGTELLRHGNGEIEDYMPTRLTDLGEIVELVSDRDWILQVPDVERRVLLAEIVGRIVQIGDERMRPFVAALRAGTRVFSEALSTQCAVSWVGDPVAP